MLEQYVQTHAKQRLFTALAYQASTRNCTASVVIKAEAHAAGTNRRAVVTNRPAPIVPQGVYDDYVQRGESENRNKELKTDLCGGRLSDHRFMANLFRLYFAHAALNLPVRLRSELPDPPDWMKNQPPSVPDRPRCRTPCSGSPSGVELRPRPTGDVASG
ncbi:MAG: transposase [Planctomycetaceae bacterium]